MPGLSSKTRFSVQATFGPCFLFFITGCGGLSANIGSASNASSGNDQVNQKTLSGWAGFPIPVFIDSQFSATETSAIQAAMTTWENAFGHQLFTKISQYDGVESGACGILSDTLQEAFSNSSEPGMIYAFTDFGYDADSGHLNSANVHFNSLAFAWEDSMSLALTPADSRPLADTQSVAVHELGHLLGFGHTSTANDPDSVMNPAIVSEEGYAKRRLSLMDIERLHAFYGLSVDPTQISSAYQNQTEIESTTKDQVSTFILQKSCLQLYADYGSAPGGLYSITPLAPANAAPQNWNCSSFPQNVQTP